MSFQDAIRDYRCLKNRGYPDKATLKLVSDHHRLGALQRNCLFRAVFARSDCRRRRRKLVGPEDVRGGRLGVDWYNVLITVESYLKGLPVFLADDGLARDSSAVHGSYRPGAVTAAATGRIFDALVFLRPDRVELFLDAPISYSGQMAENLRQEGARRLPQAPEVSVSPSADYPLKRFGGIVATSDSSIVDRPEVRAVFDLPRCALERAFGITLPTVEQLASRQAPPP